MKILEHCALALALVLVPAAAMAAVTVTISDGTTTRATNVGKFVLSGSVSASVPSTSTLNLLQSCTAPCSVGFPSGASPALSTDTFVFQDLSSTSKASVTVTKQSSTAQITLTNVKITSKVSGRTLTVTFRTASGDLGTFSTAGSFPATVALSGFFRTSLGAQASACTKGTSSPCVQSTLQVNLISLNGVGSNLSTLVTATVPCANSDPTVPCSPPGASGVYTSSTGTFSGVTDTGSVSCGTSCSVVELGTLVAKFNGSNEALTLSGSSTGATSLLGQQDPDSLTGIITALQAELGGNLFVGYTSANGLYQMVPNPPLTNQTRNINNSSTIPLSFYLLRGAYQPTNAFALLSIGCDNLGSATPCSASTPLPPASTTSDDGSYVTFIPSSLAFRDVSILQVFYDQICNTGTPSTPAGCTDGDGALDSGNPRLGNLDFFDCAAGSFRLDVTLEDPDTGSVVGKVHVYLGSNAADNFRSGCEAAEASLSGSNLHDNRDARVDTTDVGGKCCVKFNTAQGGTAGRLRVRAITLVVDQGIGNGAPTGQNYKVNLANMVVNGLSATNSLVAVANFQQVCDLPTDGTFMRITKIAQGGVPLAQPVIVAVVPSSAISTSGCKFSASVNVLDLSPVSGGITYAVEMCLFGGPSNPNDATSFEGTCPATVGIMTLL